MTNTSTLPQLQIPEIPVTECPKGNVAQIFQYFFTKYLGRATINIPGLGDVKPEKIQELEDQITKLQNQIDALDIGVRFGSVTGLDTAVGNYVVAFDTPLPDANYDIHIEFVGSGGVTATQAPGWVVLSGSKIATGFTIRCTGNANVTSFNWTARQYKTT